MKLTDLTFVDIETISEQQDIDLALSAPLFMKIFEREIQEEKTHLSFVLNNRADASQIVWNRKAGLHAEFGKIVCISIGKMVTEKLPLEEQSKVQSPTIDKFYIRSIVGRDEKTLLTQATESILRAAGDKGILVAHNGLEFDFPYLMRRYMINGLTIPPQLNVAGLKPWETKLEDTMKMWSGTNWNYKVSLELLCHIFGIESPKQDMDGSDVAKIYYDSFNVGTDELPFDKETEAMKKIGDYCSRDVKACVQIYCKMKGLPLIENVEYV